MAVQLVYMLLLAVVANADLLHHNERELLAKLTDKESQINELQSNVGLLARQIMMQQFYVEEQTRGNGDSGLKRVRNDEHGTRPYHSASHTNNKFAAIHNHANFINTIGMGEFSAVLNGVDFRTRHNDYKLAMKSTTSAEYGATEDIPFPPVPPEVSQSIALEDQIAEMKEWFKAWANQDYSVRDYRPYFKPVLCYLEGQWTYSDQDNIEESFDSDRHHLDASSWLDLQEKIRFTSYSGTKDGLENYAYLPSTVFSIVNDSIPVLAQWNFRILCHPVSIDIPLSRLKAVDDLKTRIALGLTYDDYVNSRASRFQLSLKDNDSWEDKKSLYSLLDELMGEIPGADNYGGDIRDDIMGDEIYPFDVKAKDPLNVAYYNRAFRLKKAGAMGLKTRRRGFSDQNLFIAQTTQKKVAGLPLETCNKRGNQCQERFQRWTYAIPLEIIYMTPLSTWNPYNIPYWNDKKIVYGGPNGLRRNGKPSLDTAYNGTCYRVYYITPMEFFEDEVDFDPADTTQDNTVVLDSLGKMRAVRASGYRIFLPEIPGVGSLRQRYPIVPIHGEGSSVWKELEALKDIVLQPSKYDFMYREEVPVSATREGNCISRTSLNTCDSQRPNEDTQSTQGDNVLDKNVTKPLHFMLGPADSAHESHTHNFELSVEETKIYLSGGEVDIITEEANNHRHLLTVTRITRNGRVIDLARTCDGNMRCFDGHGRRLIQVID